ncbi:MAG: diguanylate cyclase [Methylococcus sp.]|nr:diguanylate cyclase [Methylococcus sp.]
MRTVLDNIGIATLYGLLSWGTAAFLSAYGIFPSPLWPSASLSLAAAVLGGRRLWGGIFAGSFCSNLLLFHASVPLAAGVSVSNVIAPALGAWLIRRTTHTALPFFQIRHVFHFVAFGVLLHGFLSATGGVALSLLAGSMVPADAAESWWRWALSDAGGTFLFGPAMILWWSDQSERFSPAKRREGFALVIATLGFALGVFMGFQDPAHSLSGLPYLLFAPLMWFTVRFPVRDAAALLSTVGLIAIVGTIAQRGAFHLAYAAYPLLGAGLLVVALGISVLTVGALVSERRAAEARLRDINEHLERRVAERTSELHRRATEDGLTGLANRAYFLERGESLLQEARRMSRPLSALVIDVDGLKTINDTFGHHAGDHAIIRVSAACRASLRDDDLIGRLGGDEFAVLAPNVDSAGNAALIERIKLKLDDYPDTDIRVQASIGGATWMGTDADLNALLDRADAAMYKNKRRRSGWGVTPDSAQFASRKS